MTGAPNEDQRRFWSEDVGDVWVRRMEAMDVVLGGVLAGVLSRAALQPGETVFDIGCGGGTSTRAIAERVGATGTVTGLDISAPLLARARAGGHAVTFLEADAQVHEFAPNAADAILSRFGVMFFADTLAAFANMAGALRPGGRMVFATWGPPAENPFFTLPARVTRDVLGPVPKTDPDAPGPFALRDADWVLKVLQSVGLDAAVETCNVPLPLGDDAQAIADMLSEIGPIAGAFRHHDASASQRSTTLAALRTALDAHRTADGIVLTSQIHFFTATKSA